MLFLGRRLAVEVWVLRHFDSVVSLMRLVHEGKIAQSLEKETWELELVYLVIFVVELKLDCTPVTLIDTPIRAGQLVRV